MWSMEHCTEGVCGVCGQDMGHNAGTHLILYPALDIPQFSGGLVKKKYWVNIEKSFVYFERAPFNFQQI